MRPFKPLVAAALLLLCSTSAASAQTLTFDDLDCGAFLPLNTYQGFSWQNTDCFDSSLDEGLNSGFLTVGEGSNVIYGVFADPYGFSRAEAFNLHQFDAAAGWYRDVSFTIEGFLMGSLTHSLQTVLSGPETAQTFVLNWSNIDRVQFSMSGGTDIGIPLGPHSAIDNIVLSTSSPNTVVPEPATLLLIAPALAGVALIRRRSGRSQHVV